MVKKKLHCFKIKNSVDYWSNYGSEGEWNLWPILVTRDKCMSKVYLSQPVFTYSACGTFTKHREKIKKIQRNS